MESGNNLLLCPAPVPLPNTRNIRREVQKFAIDFTIACGLLKRDDIENSLPHLHHNSMDIYETYI